MLIYFECYSLVKFREWHLLLSIFLFAYVIRAIPSWLYWGWGNDFGIYYGLCLRILEYKTIFPPYDGWGASYNYFPMLYLITLAIYLPTKINLAFLLKIIAPIIGALTVIVFYFIAKELTDKKIAIVTAATLAGNPFHAYQTSHAAPLTVGHLFLTISLLLFLLKGRKKVAYPFLIISSILLVLSHHLSTAIYITIIFGIILFRALKENKIDLADIAYFSFITLFTFLYWALFATPVVYNLISPIIFIPPLIFFILFYSSAILALMLICFLKIKYSPKPFDSKREIKLLFAIFIFLLSFTILFSIEDFGTGFAFHISSVPFLLPTYIILSLSIIGWNRIKTMKNDAEIRGMLILLLFFFFSSLLIKNFILVARSIEYLAYPISLLSAVAVVAIIKEKFASIKKIAYSTFVILILISGATTYEVEDRTTNFEEKIPYEVYEAIEYLQTISPNLTVASDHRISTLLWAYGFNTTYHYAFHLWFSTNWTNKSCLRELYGYGCGGNFSKIGYVVIDSVMLRDGVQLFPNGTENKMDASCFNKFNHEPFELIFEAKSDKKLMSDDEWMEALKKGKYVDEYPFIGALDKPIPNAKEWCRVYRVNWTYIEEHLENK